MFVLRLPANLFTKGIKHDNGQDKPCAPASASPGVGTIF